LIGKPLYSFSQNDVKNLDVSLFYPIGLGLCFFFLGLAQVRFTALDLDPIYLRKNHLPGRFKTF
jgi:hypothetical protein